MSGVPKVKEGEYCYAYHGFLLYKAKVLAVHPQSTGFMYLVHYDGWNKKYDELVQEDRVQPITDSTTEDFERLKKAAAQSAGAAHKAGDKKRKDTPKAGAGGPGSGSGDKAKKAGDGGSDDEEGGGGGTDGKAAKRNKVDKETQELPPEARFAIQIPVCLKRQLVDDYQAINERKLLVTLPKKQTVADILLEFLSAKKQRTSVDKVFAEVAEGLRLYFDRALGTFLLYNFERPQYEEYVAGRDAKDLKPMSEVYGAEHLLRLFVKLPHLLAMTSFEHNDFQKLQSRLTEFLKFLQKNQARLFAPDYVAASEAYIRKVDAFRSGIKQDASADAAPAAATAVAGGAGGE